MTSDACEDIDTFVVYKFLSKRERAEASVACCVYDRCYSVVTVDRKAIAVTVLLRQAAMIIGSIEHHQPTSGRCLSADGAK